MKYIFSLCVLLTVSFTSIAQEGLYVKYEATINATNEDGEMLAMMMKDSSMELAVSTQKSWVKNIMGTMMTISMEMNIAETSTMTMLMEGMMGTMAFQGNPDDLEDDTEAEYKPEVTLIDETKEIAGYTCKKATMTDAEGNTAVYWYTEKLQRPKGVSQMPDDLPGLSLEFEASPQEGVVVIYTAVVVKKDVDMNAYKVRIPVGTEIMDLKEMAKMGG